MSSASQPGLSSFSLPLRVPVTLIPFDTRKLPQEYVEVCIIGSGAAGLCAALEASKTRSVLVLTKNNLSETATYYAQGGIAVALGGEKDQQQHIYDTLKAGIEINDEKVVEGIINEGPKRLEELLALGAKFDTAVNQNGEETLDLTREGGHSERRVLHAGGDATGQEIERTLIEGIKRNEYIRIYENTFVIDLLINDNNVCQGVIAKRENHLFVIWSNTVIIATGGVGQLYRETTNPKFSTGDGYAIAYRAGVVMQDLEFVQFHPTTLYIAGSTRVLITEAIRGEGGILRNREGHRFMPDYHPQAELAQRDVVSRAILTEMLKTGDTNVYLDVTHLDLEKVRKRFPTFAKTCEKFGIDLRKELVPVRPTAHYFIGGAKIDPDGKSSIEKLYVVGEASSSGFHGANRLGSNSLLESVVIGFRAGFAVANESSVVGPYKRHIISEGPKVKETAVFDVEDLRNAIKSLMWNVMGVIREKEQLEKALIRLYSWMRYALYNLFDSPHSWEMQNMLCLAAPMLETALKREESRGVHYRTDFTKPNNKFKKHIEIRRPD